jgi:DNA recombination protein RmuC
MLFVCFLFIVSVGGLIAMIAYSHSLKKALMVSVNEGRFLQDAKRVLEIEKHFLEEKFSERELFWQESQKTMKETVRFLAQEALCDTQNSLVSLAEKSFSSRDEKTMRPLQEAFERMNHAFCELRSHCHIDIVSLRDHIDKVQKEASRLSKALTEPTVRGKWGEMHLRRAVEIAGMLPYVDFIEQNTFSSKEVRLRPDMIIRLPMNRVIVVDAKVPFPNREGVSHLSLDAPERILKLKEYSQQVLEHIKRLGRKEYWASPDKTPDFVVMYLPGEGFLLDALFEDDSIIEESAKRRVVLASPMTLIALLKVISQCWAESELEKNAEKVVLEARRSLSHIKKYFEETAKVGRSLSKTVETFSRSQRILEEILYPSLRLLSQLTGSEVRGTTVSSILVEETMEQEDEAVEKNSIEV